MIKQNWYEIGNEDRGVSKGFSRKNPALAGLPRIAGARFVPLRNLRHEYALAA
jgi:hypothetical protein